MAQQAEKDKSVDGLSEGQKQTYDKLVAMNLDNVTQEQLIKAAQEFGTNIEGAVNYLKFDDPDTGEEIGQPDFLTEISHQPKLNSVDKKDAQEIQKEANKDAEQEDAKKKKENEKKDDQ